MKAPKFLGVGSVGLFSGYAWPTPKSSRLGPWVTVGGALKPGSNGIHACSRSSLVDWIDDELWVVELGGAIIEADGLIIARRGRLVQRVSAWNSATALAFATDCVLRVRDHAVHSLHTVGRSQEAAAIQRVQEPIPLQSIAIDVLEGLSGKARSAVEYVADAVELLEGGRPDCYRHHLVPAAIPTPGALAANLGFVAAHAAGSILGGDARTYEEASHAERLLQTHWLARHLARHL
jgi:hypothetical protein